MATLRRRIVESIADLLSSGVDWEVTTRGQVDRITGSKLGLVYDLSERKEIRNGAGCGGGEYLATLTVEVRVLVDPGQVPDGEDAYGYLDDAIGELETVIPWDSNLAAVLGVPGALYLDYGSNRKDAPDEDTGFLSATMSLDVKYKHDLANPSTLGGIA